MKKWIALLACCIFFVIAALAQPPKKTKVLLLGCFHFDNPGLDVAKFEDANILSDKRQQEVREILDKLKSFKPDKIFIEASAANQSKIDSSFKAFATGSLQLKANEIYQLGFRLAKELDLPGLQAVDYRDADFPFDSLMKSAVEAKQTDFLNHIQRSIDSIQTSFNDMLKKKTIREILLHQNTPSQIEDGVGFYYDFLLAGKEGNHVGAYLTSEWWRRNMVIYENILKRLSGKEEKILVIFGAGHTALLHEMMRYNKNLELVPVETVL